MGTGIGFSDAMSGLTAEYKKAGDEFLFLERVGNWLCLRGKVGDTRLGSKMPKNSPPLTNVRAGSVPPPACSYLHDSPQKPDYPTIGPIHLAEQFL